MLKGIARFRISPVIDRSPRSDMVSGRHRDEARLRARNSRVHRRGPDILFYQVFYAPAALVPEVERDRCGVLLRTKPSRKTTVV